MNWKRLTTVALFIMIPSAAWAADQDIHFNGLGFVTNRAKHASVVTDEKLDTLLLRRQSDGEIVAEISLDEPVLDPWSNVQVYNADFSEMTEPGVYYLEVPDFAKSRSFPISDDAFDVLLHDAMLAMYGWRSGVDVDIEHGGETFHHNAGHLEDGYLDYLGEPGVFKDGVGGWYDAGDYGKYVINGAFTAGMMLAAWEDFSETLKDVVLDIPETGGDLPDFLDEVKVELDWLLKMQFDDGSVCHKLTALAFSALEDSPEEASSRTRYFAPFATAAVADFVAVTAKAARAFEPFDPEYAATLTAASELSFAFLVDHPDNVNLEDHFEGGISPFRTGQYKTLDGDDRIWAGAELFETTGNLDALEMYESRVGSSAAFITLDGFDWSNVKNLGTFVYLKSERPERDEATVEALKGFVTDAAATVLNDISDNPFERGIRSYNWGSNGTAARMCMVLWAANRVAADEAYLDACIAQVDHLFGRNYYGRSQVTGIGYYPPCHPHDRRSVSDSVVRPYPGLLVGGGTTATDWNDTQGDFRTNEVAVNWNGALIYALAGFVSGKDNESDVSFEPIFDACTEEPPPPPPAHVEPDTETDTGSVEDTAGPSTDSADDSDSASQPGDDTDETLLDAGPDASDNGGSSAGVQAVDGTCSCSTPGSGAKTGAFFLVIDLLF